MLRLDNEWPDDLRQPDRFADSEMHISRVDKILDARIGRSLQMDDRVVMWSCLIWRAISSRCAMGPAGGEFAVKVIYMAEEEKTRKNSGAKLEEYF